MEQYDSTADTMKHRENVAMFLFKIVEELQDRLNHHDDSKLVEPEKSMYDQFTPLLRGLTYGSQEYKDCLVEMGPSLQHHYTVNSHHPEHFKMWQCPICDSFFRDDEVTIDFDPETRLCPKCCVHGAIFEATLQPASGVYGMSLLDVIEMLADWKAAGMRHANGSMAQSLAVNKARFGIDDQLYRLIENTVRELGW